MFGMSRHDKTNIILRTGSYEICLEQLQSNLPSLAAKESKQA